MAKRRDYKKEYAARQRRAKEQGFTGYSEERKARKVAQDSETFEAYFPGTSREYSREENQAAKVFYRAFYTKSGKDNYSVNGPKAKWFVEYEGIMTYDEWQKRYSTGQRYSRAA
jgi:hypothetical protein